MFPAWNACHNICCAFIFGTDTTKISIHFAELADVVEQNNENIASIHGEMT